MEVSNLLMMNQNSFYLNLLQRCAHIIYFNFFFYDIEFIVLLARNGGKTIRLIEAGKPGFPSVSQHFDSY
jgi:hypothetical protein